MERLRSSGESGREQRAEPRVSCKSCSWLTRCLVKAAAVYAPRTARSRSGRQCAVDTSHFAQAHDHAALGVRLHHAVNNLAGLIGRAILKKCHDLLKIGSEFNVQWFKVRISAMIPTLNSCTLNFE
jgi:hypothetical protein